MIYVVYAPSYQAVKIGYAADVDKRIGELQCGCPEPLQKLVAFPGEREEEAAIHDRFSEYRIHGEWFRYEGPVVRFVWDMGSEVADIPDPVPLSDVWRAVNRFDDIPVLLRRILKALDAGDVELEEPVEPPRRHFSEPIFYWMVKSFLSVEHDFDDDKTLKRLYRFIHHVGLSPGTWFPSVTRDPKLVEVVKAFWNSPAAHLFGRPAEQRQPA